MIAELCERFEIDGRVRDAALAAQARVATLTYDPQRRVAAAVLRAFFDEGIAESDLAGSTGYGYDDAARARYESLLARIFGVERALARLSIVSGTHAIVASLAACTPPGRTLLSITGRPYDTLRNAISDAAESLVHHGVVYREIALGGNGAIDFPAVEEALAQDPEATVFIQRSRGYAPRRSLYVAECEEAIARVKRVAPDAVTLVDNCYGELVEEREPSHAGADLVMGSLIKNLGGSLAPAGAYVAGRAALVARVAARIYAPGLADSLGPTLHAGRALIQGLFLAPKIVEESLRGLDFVAALFEALGYRVDPEPGTRRTDIVQAICLGSPDALRRFATGLQAAMPVNARFRPEPGRVPGYAEPVLMSSGSFVSGATIELSCDAPMRAPFEVYVQGGVSAAHAYLGALFAAHALQA
ncbi:MAG TPA: methionine gamma-lyase family protein [Candidatus Cybelea sp.]|jgi:cystathionine beta-lyase family protein involved in aluminum resistance|nr:methionine gamma-lyase family protein [Candidatus Cybelea sp.]